MADNEIRVVISGVASDLREALTGAKGDLGGLSAAIKAVPDKIRIDVAAETTAAVARLRDLQLRVGMVPDQINIVADADTGIAMAKLGLLNAAIRDTERKAAAASLGGSFLAAGAGAGGGGGAGLLGTALMGGGGALAGTAALGSVGSLAGFGLEHVVTTIMGLIGYALKGAAGGGLIAAGAAGTLAVGGGSDAAVMSSTIGDTKALSQGLTAVSTAAAQYGAKSMQAKQATQDLGAQMAALGDTAGVKAEVGLAKAGQAVDHLFDLETSAARVTSVQILDQVLQLGRDYVPRVAAAAQSNLTIINGSLKPLFAWLEGPQGVGIWVNLEDHFRTQLPTAMDAFKQALELVLRVVDEASNYTGHFVDYLDRLFTRLNAKSNGQLNDEIGKLVDDFRAWEGFFKILLEDIDLFFKQGAGTAPAIVTTLTQMLEKLHEWETSIAGQASIRNIFVVHKDEIVALLQALVPLVSGFGRLYMVVAPPLVTAVTLIAKAFTDVVTAILSLGSASPILQNVLVLPLAGLALSAKLFGASNVWTGLRQTAVAMGLINAEQSKANQLGGLASGVTGGPGGGLTGIGGKQLKVDESSGQIVESNAGELRSSLIKGLAIAGIGTLVAQGIGSSIHGALGKAVSDVGTGASIGGGLGSVFGPWGAAVGAALGGGLGAAVDLFTSQGPSDGEKWAKAFSASLPGQLSAAEKKGLAKGLDNAPPLPGSGKEIATPHGILQPPSAPGSAETQAQLATFVKYASTQGAKAGSGFAGEMEKTLKFPTPLLLSRDIADAVAKVPVQVRAGGPAAVAAWQDNAAKEMLAYATSLQQNGKLPQGSVNDLIASLEAQFPGLTAYLNTQSQNSAQAIAQNLKLGDALSNLKTALGDMRTQWGDTAIATKITNENIYSNTAQAMSDLRLLMKSKNEQIRTEATAEYNRLRDETNTSFTTMVSQTAASMSKMSALIQSGSQTAAAAAATNFDNVQNAVYSGMASGVISTGEGAKLIGQALNAELKAFGAKQIPITSVIGALPRPTSTVGHQPGHAAGGGFFGSPGQRGHDTIPIMVGAGEAILNHHQQAPVDFALHATFGMGLGDLFQNVTQPHYMAKGGFAGGGVVTASEFVAGPHTASGRTFVPGYAELSNPPSSLNFSALGHLPMGTVLPVSYGGRTIRIPKIDVGAGGGGLDGHVRAIDLSMEAAGMLPGFPGLANVLIGPAGGVSITGGGGGGGGASNITAPGVKGTGTAADLTRASLSQLATAANAYANSHQPATGAGAGGGGTLPNFKVAPGPVPAPVQRALATARFELGKPYHAPGYGLDAPALDCSGYVSTILNQAGLDPAGYLLTGGLKTWGQAGPGKWITVGVWGADSGPLGHTMIEIDGQFFESGGGPLGPHVDKTWSMPFTTWRHPAGLAKGGFAGGKRFAKGGMVAGDGPDAGYVGRPGHQLSQKAYQALMHKRGAAGSTIGKFARGGFAGMRQRFAPGGVVARSAAATRPPAAHKIAHPKVPKVHVPRTISDSLKRLLPADVVHFDTIAARYATKQGTLATADDQLTYTQTNPASMIPQPLVTLSDADVQVMDPTGSIGYQVGDEIVNQSGMIAGRFFGPDGVDGGTFIPGIDQREAQIGAQLSNLYGQSGALHSAGQYYGNATTRELQARQQRDQRRKRVIAFLRLQVIKAKAVQAELAAITTGNLKQNVARALSRQAIGKRLADLRSNRQTVSQELSAERRSQGLLLPIERDPTHTNALIAQLQGITDAVSVESQLSSSGAAGVAVKASKSALLKNSLTNRLKSYANVDRELGGSPYDVGTGGIAGLLQRQMDALDQSRTTDLGNKSALAPTMQSITNAIAAYVTEKNGLPGTKPIQVRPGPGETAQDQALLQLTQTQLQTATQALAISQSQFGVLAGFGSLLSGLGIGGGGAPTGGGPGPPPPVLKLPPGGRGPYVPNAARGGFAGFADGVMGSYQTGISSVPKTGPYLLHKGETVTPDPGGPQGNRAAATVQTAQGPVSIEITFANNDTPLVKLITATMNQKALQIVSDHSGQRARLIAGVRR